ncbi:uncharacterized protein LTR77_007887 [Saxophila tyrrhenica]|uniref:Glycoside hydrolase family 2 protein n=1 Tax=Saxophila tyrrhenica TaxID=1690608 RepID=A0AAV9P6N2_9PEZI|nr:hypothetical protein LTR77_007887 [Saxophila tyrrhenica]
MPVSTDEHYPRPDFQRPDLQWQSLNGQWDFLFDDKDIGLSHQWHKQGLQDIDVDKDSPRTIQVPFVFQSEASGIHLEEVHETLWYERMIQDIRTDGEKHDGYRLQLRFGAVDYAAKIWLDGSFIGEHRGGHVPFDLDLTDAVSPQSKSERDYRLTVRVFDSATDLTQPRGKQYWKPKLESIYYTPSSGIWQDVWLESVPPLRLADSSHGTIIRSQDIEGGKLDARIVVFGRRAGQQCSVQLETSLSGTVVKTSDKKKLPQENFARFNHNMRLSNEQMEKLSGNFLRSNPPSDAACWRNDVALWSPEHPTLYDLTLRLFDAEDKLLDEVHTTTGMRSINWTKGDESLRLNGRPYFQALFLDQGYWPETLMTPPDSKSLKKDIELSKAMGFNGCRKHQKVEDPLFMYYADQLGFLVWGEMASAFRFSVDMIERFDQEWMEMVRRDINHPCIVAWTPANESWGYPDLKNNTRQRDHLRSLYYSTKALDPTRPINDNCGWEHVLSDLSTFHDYADADGMAERCRNFRSILEQPWPTQKQMFVKPIYGANGLYDPGTQHKPGAPILCTEFGGVRVAGKQKDGWGYTTADDSSDLLKRVEKIITATVKSGIVCGFVWTQLTDILQEENGLYTYEREEKVPAERMRAVIDAARETYYDHQT